MTNALARKLALHRNARNELLACPFCGGEAKLVYVCAWGGLPENHRVECLDCGAGGPPFFAHVWIETKHVTQDSAKLAIERWNRRDEPKPPRPPPTPHRTGLAPRKD